MLLLFVGAAGLTVVCMLVLYQFSKKYGLVDRPDEVRKTHEGDIPVIGGLAIFICLLSFQLISANIPSPVIYGMLLLVSVGLVDDCSDLGALPKLICQFVAAGILVKIGHLEIISLGTLPSGKELLLGDLSFPFTLICIVALVNAMNMIDGLDGLVGGLSLLSLIFLFVAGQLSGSPIGGQLLAVKWTFAGCLTAFLCFNLNIIRKRKVFLGDAGSMMIGLIFSFLLIQACQRLPATDALPASIIPWIVSVPVLDALTVVMSRLIKGQAPMQADRTHLHHCLIDVGFSDRQTLLIILGFSVILFAIGIILLQLGGLHAGLGFFFLIPVYSVMKTKLLINTMDE